MSHHFEIRRLHRTTTPYIYRQHKVVNSVEFTTLCWFVGAILEKTIKPPQTSGHLRPPRLNLVDNRRLPSGDRFDANPCLP